MTLVGRKTLTTSLSPQTPRYHNYAFSISRFKVYHHLAYIRSFSTLWRHVQRTPHVESVQWKNRSLCVAGVQWRTSVLGGHSAATALWIADGCRAPASVSPPLSLPPSSFWTPRQLYVAGVDIVFYCISHFLLYS